MIISGVAWLLSQGGHRGSGGGSPLAGVQVVWGSQIYTNNLQLSSAFLRRFVAESVLHLPLPPTKASDLRESQYPGQCERAHTWLRD